MTVQLREDFLGVLYPAFIRTDPEGRLDSFGPAIGRHVSAARRGRSWSDVFDNVGPPAAPPTGMGDWAHVRIASKDSAVELNGAVVREASGLVYLLTPSIQDRASPTALGLNDFPPGDSGIANMITISLQRALIEESQALVEELADARSAAESALQTQTDFLNGISHALRTPLASLVLYADLMDGRHDIAADPFTDRFRDAVMDLKSKLDNLIEFSALRAGRVRAAPYWCEGARLAAGLAPLKELARRRGLSFACDLGDLAARDIFVDAGLVDQLLQNLVQNAIAFTKAGAVEVRFDGSAAHRLHVEVQDTGAGDPALEQASTFPDFFSGTNPPPPPEGQALGLGLAICREIVRVLGGDIGVKQSGPDGSTFWFEVPAETR